MKVSDRTYLTCRNCPKLLLRILVSGLAIALVFHGTDISKLFETISRIQFDSLIIVVPSTIAVWILLTWRLQIMLPEGGIETFKASFFGTAIGIFGNAFLPLRGGDVLRCTVMNKLLPNAGLTPQIGILLLEKILEITSIISILFFWAAFIHPSQWQGTFTLAGIAMIGGIVLIIVGHKIFLSLLKSLKKTFPIFLNLIARIESIYIGLAQGFASLSCRKRAPMILLQTLALRLFDGLVFYGFAVGLGLELGIMDSVMVFCFVALAMAIPAAPGFIGTYDFMAVTALNILGIKGEMALAYVLLVHSWHLSVWIVVGLISILILPVGKRTKLLDELPPAQG